MYLFFLFVLYVCICVCVFVCVQAVQHGICTDVVLQKTTSRTGWSGVLSPEGKYVDSFL